MKKTNKILRLVMAMVLMCLSMVCVSADEMVTVGVSADDVLNVNESIFLIGYGQQNWNEGIIGDNNSDQDEIIPMNATGCGMTASQAKKAAAALGYTQVANQYSHGQPIFYNSKNVPHYITADADGHNGGVWKGANSIADLGSKSTRLGTYDADLNWIGE